ncbi:hypothetical protein A2U01_0083017, partial [Trifolium medium]|nr:hypothetical protein [Trifolium medium]
CLLSTEPGVEQLSLAQERKKMYWEVLPSAPGVGILELGAGAGICTYKLETQSQN